MRFDQAVELLREEVGDATNPWVRRFVSASEYPGLFAAVLLKGQHCTEVRVNDSGWKKAA